MPAPGIFQHLDLTFVNLTGDGVTLNDMLQFCSKAYRHGVSADDYYRAALLALKSNPTSPMSESSIENFLAGSGDKRNNPARSIPSVAPLLKFLDDPTWE